MKTANGRNRIDFDSLLLNRREKSWVFVIEIGLFYWYIYNFDSCFNNVAIEHQMQLTLININTMFNNLNKRIKKH